MRPDTSDGGQSEPRRGAHCAGASSRCSAPSFPTADPSPPP